MRYQPVIDGDWIRPTPRGYRAACCDCGLVHVVDFRFRRGYVEFRVRRDARATARRRQQFAIARQHVRAKGR